MERPPETGMHIDANGDISATDPDARQLLQRFQPHGGILLPTPPQVVVTRRAAARGGNHNRAVWLTGQARTCPRLLDVFGLISQARWSGQLQLVNATTQRTIVVDDGHVIGGHSNHASERLGTILRRYGIVSSEQIGIVMGAVRPHVRFGDAAVKLGFVSRTTLFRYLKRQIQEIVFAALTMIDGTFTFVGGDPRACSNIAINLPMPQLLLEGARRIDEMSHFQQLVPSSQHIAERIAGTALPAPAQAQRAAFGAINGARTIDEVAAVAGLSTFDTTRAVYELLRAKRIRLRPPRVAGLRGAVEAFNEAMREVMRGLSPYPNAQRRVERQLAAFARRKLAHGKLLARAGPKADGSFDVERVLRNLLDNEQPGEPAARLNRWLYEYASFAMFTAEPALRAGTATHPAAIAQRVAHLLAPLTRAH